MMGKYCACPVHKAAWWLLIIGGLNWLLVGLAGYDLVATLLGYGTWAARLVYILIGLSALAMLLKGKCSKCKAACSKDGMGGGCMCGHDHGNMGGSAPSDAAKM